MTKFDSKLKKNLEKTLEFILPDDAVRGFDIGEIAFSSKDSIISTITSVNEAQQRIEKLRDAVNLNSTQIKDTVAALEVAVRNTEAAERLNKRFRRSC